MKQLTGTTANKLKIEWYHAQNGTCKICGRELDSDILKNHLDHDHSLDGPQAGRVRGLLCNLCNVTEGKLKHKFGRSGLLKYDVDYIEWLKSLVKYLETDYSPNDYHPNFITDTIKQFKRLGLAEMQSEMIRKNYTFEPKDTKADLVKKYSKQFRKEQKEL